MQMRPNTSMAAVPGTDFSGLANLMAMKGRGGDNTLVHMSKSELPYLNMLAKSAGYQQGLPVNPETGLPEANILKTILPVAGAILGGMFLPGALPAFLGKGALATGIGAGLGSFGGSLLSGRSLKDAAIGGLISGGLSGLGAATFGGQSFMGDQLAANPATTGSVTAQEAVQQSMVQNPALAGQTGAGFDASLADYAQSGLAPGSIIPGRAADLQAIAPTVGADSLAAADFAVQQATNVAAPTPFYTPFTGAGSTVASDTAASLSNIDPSKFVRAETLAEASPVKFTEEFLTQNVDKYVPTSRLEAVSNLPKDPGFFDPKSLYGYQPGMDKLEYLKYAAKPAMTAGAAGIGLDAALGQGAFEPIDYSSFPQAGEERRVSPFDTSGIRFATRRTGAFPRTEEEALAFAQPGGTRQRFFDQRFFTSAKTGGGLAALQVGGRPKTALDAAMAPDDEEGGLGTGTTSSASGGLSNQTTGGLIGSGLGALGKAALGIGMFSPVGLAVSLGSNLIGQAIGSQQDQAEADAATAAAVASIAEDEMSIEDEDTTSGTQAAADAVAAAQAAAASQAAAAQALAEMDDFGDTSGGGGGASTTGDDGDDVGGFGGIGGPTGADDTSDDPGGGSSGGGSSDADASSGDPIKTGGLISEVTEMAQGGSFLEQMLAGGLGATDKAQDILGKLPKPLTALLGGAGAPMLAEKFMGKPAGDITAPPPPVRAMEAPVEAPPPPTDEELEEMRNIAMMQQVLSGVPVEAQAGGLISAYQMGGPPSPYFEGMVKGRGDGMSDSIPFTIEGTQPAILSRDEYVLPADIVSMMGNGSSDAGAEKIDSFINDFRVQKYGRGKQPPETRRGLSGVA